LKNGVNSQGNIVDPVEDGMVGELGFELRTHVACSVDSDEGETTSVLLGVPGNLLSIHVCDVVGSPLLNDGPVHVGDPVLGSEGRYSTINVTRVLEHLVATEEHGVDPESGILLRSVVKIVSAKVPLG